MNDLNLPIVERPPLKPVETWNSEQVKLWLEHDRIWRHTGIQCPSCSKELLREHNRPIVSEGPPQMVVVCEDPLCGYCTFVIAPLES